MENENEKKMNSFVEKLCDHLSMDRVKHLIDNGFDDWETITFMKGEELVDLGYGSQECLMIMVSANATAKQFSSPELFEEVIMREVGERAKENERKQLEYYQQEEMQRKKIQQSKEEGASKKSISSPYEPKQYPKKQISENMLLRATTMKPKPGEKIVLQKITMISLEDKEITDMENVMKVPAVVNLHLANNRIYQMVGMNSLNKIKVLRLQHNLLVRIEGLQGLVSLQRLNISHNHISCLQKLQHNKSLHYLNISNQKINGYFTFDPSSIDALAYCLEKLQCDKNKVTSISQLKYLRVIHEISLVKNELGEISQLSETLPNFQMLKSLSLKDNPLAKAQKYRDYIVILSKNLEELDGKKILTTEREYLVKLYALKHAKQEKQFREKQKTSPKNSEFNLEGLKMDSQHSTHAHNLNRATDLRGNAPFANTKHARK